MSQGAYVTGPHGKPVWNPNAQSQRSFSKRDRHPTGKSVGSPTSPRLVTSLSPQTVRSISRNTAFAIPGSKRSALVAALRPVGGSAPAPAAPPAGGGFFEGIDPVGQAAIGGAATGATLGIALGPQGALLGAGLGAAIGGLGSFFGSR